MVSRRGEFHCHCWDWGGEGGGCFIVTCKYFRGQVEALPGSWGGGACVTWRVFALSFGGAFRGHVVALPESRGVALPRSLVSHGGYFHCRAKALPGSYGALPGSHGMVASLLRESTSRVMLGVGPLWRESTSGVTWRVFVLSYGCTSGDWGWQMAALPGSHRGIIIVTRAGEWPLSHG